jgi:hypothetical protein
VCFIDENRELGIRVAVIFPTLLLFAVVKRNTFYLSQFTHLERKATFLF